MVSSGSAEELLELPFPGSLQKEVDTLLSEHASKEVDLPPWAMRYGAGMIPYFKILHAFRLRRGDYRGAAAVLVERLEARHEQRATMNLARFGGAKREAERALDEYLVGINALALLKDEDGAEGKGDEEAWVFVEGRDGAAAGGEGARAAKKRRVIRLDGLRSRYQDEMDRIGVLEMGRWGIVDGGEEMET